MIEGFNQQKNETIRAGIPDGSQAMQIQLPEGIAGGALFNNGGGQPDRGLGDFGKIIRLPDRDAKAFPTPPGEKSDFTIRGSQGEEPDKGYTYYDIDADGRPIDGDGNIIVFGNNT